MARQLSQKETLLKCVWILPIQIKFQEQAVCNWQPLKEEEVIKIAVKYFLAGRVNRELIWNLYYRFKIYVNWSKVKNETFSPQLFQVKTLKAFL